MSEDRRPIGHLYVDPDAPGVVVHGDAVFVYPVDENGEPTQASGPPVTLGDGWKDVGFTEDYEGPALSALWPQQRAALEVHDLDPGAASILLGLDPSSDGVAEPTYGVEVRATRHLCPFVTPRKRKGLTGKAYRIARRQWARKVKAWERGLIPDRLVEVRYYASPTSIDPIPGDPGAFSVGFRASPQRAKPGYSDDHE